MRFLNIISWPFLRGRFMSEVWTTFDENIYYPIGFDDDSEALTASHIINHELVHVKQYKDLGKLGFLLWYFILPLPFFFSGRWWLERKAYLVDLNYYMSIGYTKEYSVNMIVKEIDRFYVRPWPKTLMKKWFMEV